MSWARMGVLSEPLFHLRADEQDLLLDVPRAPHSQSSRVEQSLPKREGFLSFHQTPQVLSWAP